MSQFDYITFQTHKALCSRSLKAVQRYLDDLSTCYAEIRTTNLLQLKHLNDAYDAVEKHLWSLK